MSTKADVLAAYEAYEQAKRSYIERAGWTNHWNIGWSRGTVYNRTVDEAMIITMADEDSGPSPLSLSSRNRLR